MAVLMATGMASHGSTRHYRGVITAVSPDEPTIELTGVNLHKCLGVCELSSWFHTWAVFVEDDRLVPARQALVKGRQYCGFHEGAVQVLSEEADLYEGRVVSLTDDTLVLDVVMAQHARAQPPTNVTRRVQIPLELPARVQVGQQVRVTPGRGAVVDALSQPAGTLHFPDEVAKATKPPAGPKIGLSAIGSGVGALDDGTGELMDGMGLGKPEVVKPDWVNNVWIVVEGLVKSVDDSALKMWAFRDGKAELVSVPPTWSKQLVIRDANQLEAAKDMIAPGHWIVYAQVSKRGGPAMVGTHVFGITPDDGRLKGILRSIKDGELTVTTLTVGGAKDVTVSLPSPAVRLDGHLAAMEDLAPGMPIVVFSPRQQTIVTL